MCLCALNSKRFNRTHTHTRPPLPPHGADESFELQTVAVTLRCVCVFPPPFWPLHRALECQFKDALRLECIFVVRHAATAHNLKVLTASPSEFLAKSDTMSRLGRCNAHAGAASQRVLKIMFAMVGVCCGGWWCWWWYWWYCSTANLLCRICQMCYNVIITSNGAYKHTHTHVHSSKVGL